MAPHDKQTLQGEVQLSERWLDLRYTFVKKPMRESLAEQELYASGLKAIWLLKTYFDPASYDWLQHLFDAYPGHVIEFSCFSVNWGTIPNRNTVVWECRLY